MNECKHGLDIGTCASCRTAQSGPYFITKGGSHYHARQDCRTLVSGQSEAIDRGYQTHSIETVTLAEIERRGRVPCRNCVGR